VIYPYHFPEQKQALWFFVGALVLCGRSGSLWALWFFVGALVLNAVQLMPCHFFVMYYRLKSV